MQSFLSIYRFLFARAWEYRIFFHFYKLILRSVGVLNSEGPIATGEAWFLEKLAKNNAIHTIIDVGANTDVYGALEIKDAKIYAFEPHPLTFKKLQNQIQKLGLKNVRAFQLALGAKKAKQELWDFADSAALKTTQPTSTLSSLNRSVIEELHGQPAQGFTVQVDTLDAVSKKYTIPKIDLLKIDAEGFEFQVLQGAKQLLAQNKIRIIQFEFNEMNVHTRTFMKDFMELLHGHEFFRLLPNGLLPLGPYRPITHEIFAFQNIVAIPKNDPMLAQLVGG